MKLTKIIAAILAVVLLMTMFTACNTGNSGATTPPAGEGSGSPDAVRYKAKVNVIVTDVTGERVYETDPEEPYEYDSGYYEPYIFTFLEDLAFMNSKEFDYTATKYTADKKDENGDVVMDEDGNPVKVTLYTLKSISITVRKRTKVYSAEKAIISEVDGSEQITYWICMVNGEEVENMNETLLKDGDTVEFRLTYKNQEIKE